MCVGLIPLAHNSNRRRRGTWALAAIQSIIYLLLVDSMQCDVRSKTMHERQGAAIASHFLRIGCICNMPVAAPPVLMFCCVFYFPLALGIFVRFFFLS